MQSAECRCLLAHLQRLEQRRFGGVHHFDVVLVRARGRDHVDHLFDRVDVGVRHIALGIRQRVGGVELAPAGLLAFLDGFDAHAASAIGTHRGGFKYHLARFIDLAIGPGHGIDVGQVAGNDVQALRLRADGAARDAENSAGKTLSGYG